MKYGAHKVFARIAQLIALSILTCAAPAFAQFEVSPDHFDSGPKVQKQKAAKTSVKKTGALSAKTSTRSKDQSQIPVVESSARKSRGAAGQSQHNGKLALATNAAAAKPEKRAPVGKVVLASTQ